MMSETKSPKALPVPTSDPARNRHPLVRRYLRSRDMKNPDDIRQFLDHTVLHDTSPRGIKGMYEAAKRLLKAMSNRDPIFLFAANGVDGSMSLGLLLDWFRGYKVKSSWSLLNGSDYPHFLSWQLGDLLTYQIGTTPLVVMLDIGITPGEAAQYAATKHADVIVISHHDIVAESYSEQAVTVINPKQEGSTYPHTELCCCALVQKLVAEMNLVQHYSNYDEPKMRWRVPKNDAERSRYVELVATATLADRIRLDVPESRSIVRRAITTLRERHSIGWSAIFDACGIDAKRIDAPTLFYGVIPRIDLACRRGETGMLIELLLTRSERIAETDARVLFRPDRGPSILDFFEIAPALETPVLVRDFPVVEVALSELDELLFKGLECLEPTGTANPGIPFATKAVRVIAESVQTTRDGVDLEVRIQDETGRSLACYCPGMGHQSNNIPPQVDIVYILGHGIGHENEPFRFIVLEMTASGQGTLAGARDTLGS